MPYELRQRERAGADRKGFDAGDVLYMLMPDRFANGDPSNDNIEGMSPYVVDRSQPSARHGGDIRVLKNISTISTSWVLPLCGLHLYSRTI